MKNIKKGILIILILFNIFIPSISFATGEPIKNSPVTLTTGLPFFPKNCTDITEEKRKEALCYKIKEEYTGAYKSQGLIKEVFEGLFKFIIGSAGTLCVIMLIVSGLQMAFAAGNAEVLGKSRDRMKNSVIGLILTVSSGFILSIINPQLLNFDFKEPSKFVISGFNELQGKPGAKCMLSFPAGATNIQDGEVEIGCNHNLYCYVPKIEEGNVIGQCKKYLESGDYCETGELCKLGYNCRPTAGNTMFTCVPSASIDTLKEGESCFVGNLNCEDNLFCYPNSSPNILSQVEGVCVSCDLVYDQLELDKNTIPSSPCFDSNVGYCNTYEVKTKDLCEYDKDLGENCNRDGECSSFTCVGGKCVNRTCSNNNDCDYNEICDITEGVCKNKKSLEDECTNNNECETGQCEGKKCVCAKDSDCPTGKTCKIRIGVNSCE